MFIGTIPPWRCRFADRDQVRILLGLVLTSVVLIAPAWRSEVRAEPGTAAIVGLGATTCQRFNDDVRSNPAVQRDYLAWAQGFMSGILLGRPAGVDQGLDLNPPSFGMLNQLQFLEEFCARNSSKDFADAVEALYKRLRAESRT
jgi:hypothetical protein